MDAPKPENAKTGKYYMLTNDGIAYIESYTPKENSGDKKKSRVKAKKSISTISEAYVSITADDLNTRNYPAVKSLSGAKEQIIMAMYIVTNEGKGEWFTVEDIIHLLINVFGVPADKDKVNACLNEIKECSHRNKIQQTKRRCEENCFLVQKTLLFQLYKILNSKLM